MEIENFESDNNNNEEDDKKIMKKRNSNENNQVSICDLLMTDQDNSEVLKTKIEEVTYLVHELEDNIIEADETDRKLFSQLQCDSFRSQILSSHLEEARKENEELKNIIREKLIIGEEETSSRTASRSTLDSSSLSTVSMVNLQYKYEELLASYEGLLKILEHKGRELNKYSSENEQLKNQIKDVSKNLIDCQKEINNVCQKYLKLKERKDRKMKQLKEENEALRLAHDNLVNLLSKFSLEQDREYQEELKRTKNPNKALLLNEIRNSNSLRHENFLLQQEVYDLKLKLNRKKSETQVEKT